MKNASYTIIRSNRKSVALIIDSTGKLIVRAPRRISDSDIAMIVELRQGWITEKQRQVAAAAQKYAPVRLKSGSSLPFMGKVYSVRREASDGIAVSGQYILIPRDSGLDDVIAWMQSAAAQVIGARVTHFAELMGVPYSSWRLSAARTRWGSCGAKNSLNFAWRLIICPLAVIDYVVVHELCHVAEKNHGPQFWARVEAVLPDYRARREWLRANARLMDII